MTTRNYQLAVEKYFKGRLCWEFTRSFATAENAIKKFMQYDLKPDYMYRCKLIDKSNNGIIWRCTKEINENGELAAYCK